MRLWRDPRPRIWGLLLLGFLLTMGIVSGLVVALIRAFEVDPVLGFALWTSGFCAVARNLVRDQLVGEDPDGA